MAIDYTALLEALPRCPEVIGRDETRRSVVLAPFMEIGGELHLLFEKRAPEIRQGDEICFPGGGTEERDRGDLALTALRETEEELGIPRAMIHVDGRAGSHYSALGQVVDLFVGRIDARGLQDFNPNPKEVSRLLLVPFQWFIDTPPERYELEVQFHPYIVEDPGGRTDLLPARELGLPERYWERWQTRRNPVFVYTVEGEVIWGLTALMVRHLVGLLGR